MSGGGNGGIESALGVIAPIALSAMFPGIGTAIGAALPDLGLGLSSGTLDAIGSGLFGAATSGATAALTGGNPLTAALMGGIGSGVGSELMPTPGGAAGAAGADNGVNPTAQTFATDASGQPTQAATDAFAASPLSSQTPNTPNTGGGGITGWLGKQNPLTLALAGGTALSGIQSLLPHKQVNVGQNAANVMSTNPGFSNATLPQYSMQNTASPYQGNWYTYGQQPEQVMYNARPIAQAKGGMVGYAHGGRVRGYAMGGMPMGGVAPQMPPQGAPTPQQQPPMSQKPVNPLMLKAVHEVGVAIGKHLKNKKTPLGAVHGVGGGQDDAIPAKLSDGEFIMPADVVSKLGDGSSDAGGKKLMKVIHGVRAHTATTGFPPKSKKNPLSYIGT